MIDDAQWLDTPSADALVFTARRVGAEGIAVLFAARDGERRHFDAQGLDELVLAGLDHSSARVLLDRGTPELAPAVRERLLEDAAGNPLALLELPAGLSDDAAGRPGALARRDTAELTPAGCLQSTGPAAAQLHAGGSAARCCRGRR